MEAIEKIFETEDRTELIDKCVDYIIDEYVKHGGNIKDASRDITMWTLEGIYERDGKSGVKEFMQNWRPHITHKSSVGYA